MHALTHTPTLYTQLAGTSRDTLKLFKVLFIGSKSYENLGTPRTNLLH